jgi:hypothetical protein
MKKPKPPEGFLRLKQSADLTCMKCFKPINPFKPCYWHPKFGSYHEDCFHEKYDMPTL